MDETLATIEEVQEGGKRLANHFLRHGYILLDIQQGARAQRFPDGNLNGRQYFVRRNPVYVLGRPKNVKEAPAPPEWTKSKDKVEEEAEDDH